MANRCDRADLSREFIWLTLDEANAWIMLWKPEVEAVTQVAAVPVRRAATVRIEVAVACGCGHPLNEHGKIGCRRCKCEFQPSAKPTGG